MARYANMRSRAAARLTAIAHTQASLTRWGTVLVLGAIWIVGGLVYWLAPEKNVDWSEAVYRTISAVGMWDSYFARDGDTAPMNLLLQLVRFAALATPVVGLLFAFSGQVGRAMARIFNLGAARHVVIAGASPAALSLALDCRHGHKDAVFLLAEGLPEETTLGLRRNGVIVLEADAKQIDTLRTARANHAAHVVAFEEDDTENLQIEAAVRRLVGNARRRRPLGVHVSTHSPMLLREAREMRSAQTSKKKAKNEPSPIDPKPFSLNELAARGLLQSYAFELLNVAQQLGEPRVHIVFFGFDRAAEAVAERILSSLWSAHFEAPRLTVLAPDPALAEAGFRARHREAFAHGQLWSADISFMPFDWDAASVGPELLDAVEQSRGRPTAAVVSTGSDPGNIHLSIALKRACNHGLRWPIPIFMHETSQSEFSLQYARGDETPDVADAYLQAFGAHQITATRAWVIDGALDTGAAIAHEHYERELSKRGHLDLRELQAATRDWENVLETYRAANRAVADASAVKLWDAGWRPAGKKEKGDLSPTVPDELMPAMAQREHDRWVAERLMSGWRPTGAGEQRNNDLMAHNMLKPWSDMSQEDREKDAVQVRAAMDIQRLQHPRGFVRR